MVREGVREGQEVELASETQAIPVPELSPSTQPPLSPCVVHPEQFILVGGGETRFSFSFSVFPFALFLETLN